MLSEKSFSSAGVRFCQTLSRAQTLEPWMQRYDRPPAHRLVLEYMTCLSAKRTFSLSCVLVSPALQRLSEGVGSLLNGLSALVSSFSSLHVIQICLEKTLSPAPSASVCVTGKTVKADWTDSEIKSKEGFMSNTKSTICK